MNAQTVSTPAFPDACKIAEGRGAFPWITPVLVVVLGTHI